MTPADLRTLASARAELFARHQALPPDPDRVRALQSIDALLDRQTAPLIFKRDPAGWRAGTSEDLPVRIPSDAIGSALSFLHAALSSPGDPWPINANLNTARIRKTRARQFIALRCPALADLVGEVAVGHDDQGGVVATYNPLPGAREVLTR